MREDVCAFGLLGVGDVVAGPFFRGDFRWRAPVCYSSVFSVCGPLVEYVRACVRERMRYMWVQGSVPASHGKTS